jgi:hypothetical protein
MMEHWWQSPINSSNGYGKQTHFSKKSSMFIVHKPFFFMSLLVKFHSKKNLVLSQVELDVIPLTCPNGFYQVMFTIEEQLFPHSWFKSQVELAQEKVEGAKGHLSNLGHTLNSYLNKTPKPGLKYLVHQVKHIIWWNHGLIIVRLYWVSFWSFTLTYLLCGSTLYFLLFAWGSKQSWFVYIN